MNAEHLFERLTELGADLSQFDSARVGVWQRLSAGKRSKPIAVKVHRTDPLLATVGDWRQGDFETVRDDRPLAREESARLRTEAARSRRLAEQDTKARQMAAQEVAAANLRRALPARAEHAYLTRKGVKPHGIFESCGELLIPMFDTHGELWSHQTIFGDGTKLYLKDGRRRGCFFLIGENVTDLLVLAEGYATAASIHEATGWPVAVAFDAHGIRPVAEELRRKWRSAQFVFAADDDAHLARNVGLEAARDAARAVGGMILSPQFESGVTGTDWNDYARAYGRDGVAWAMSDAMERARHG